MSRGSIFPLPRQTPATFFDLLIEAQSESRLTAFLAGNGGVDLSASSSSLAKPQWDNNKPRYLNPLFFEGILRKEGGHHDKYEPDCEELRA